MRQTILCAIALAGFVLLTGCTGEKPPAGAEAPAFQSVDMMMASRGVEVPITLVTPTRAADERFPLVVLAHGHGGSRWEGGAFPAVAEALALKGIASVRMDFPGCGDSTESFAENNLSNMLQRYVNAANGTPPFCDMVVASRDKPLPVCAMKDHYSFGSRTSLSFRSPCVAWVS